VNAELDRAPDGRSLLLVHGVGHHRPGVIREIVSNALAGSGFQSVAASEIEWDGLYRPERPVTRLLDVADLTALGHAFWTSSWLGIERPGPLTWRRRVVRGTSWLLSASVAIGILAALWWLLAWSATRIAWPVPPLRLGLPWTAYLFPPVPADLLARSAPAARATAIFSAAAVVSLSLLLTLTAWTIARAPFASALRMAAFQVLWFPTYLLGMLPTILTVLAGAAFAIGFVSTAFDLKFTIQLPDGASWDLGPGWRELLSAAGAAIVLGALGAAAGWLLWRALKPIIDVVRYLGDEQLRAHVRDQLSAAANTCAPGTELIVAAHSLGTVIAVDALLGDADVWSRFRRIDLLTAGSPLHRLLARFFRETYPPVHQLAAVLSRRYPGCRWANVYRPTDYVGGRLPTALIANRRLWRSAWRTHSNYWGDRNAIAWLAEQLNAGSSVAVNDSALREVSDGVRAEPRFHPLDVASRPLGWVATPIAVLGFVGIVWAQFGWTPRMEQANLAEWQRRVSAGGTSAIVEAVAAKAIDTASDPAQAGDYKVVAFAYRAAGRVYGAESNVESLFYASSRYPHVDWQKLKAKIESSTRHSVPVEIVYAAAEPRMFVVPSYEAHPSYYGAGRIALYTMRTVLMGGCWLLWCAFLRTLLEHLAPGDNALRRTSPSTA
jgi:hypothetical protein